MDASEQLYHWSLQLNDYPLKETASMDRRSAMTANAQALRQDITALLESCGILKDPRIDRTEGSPAGLQAIVTTQDGVHAVREFIAAHVTADITFEKDYPIDNATKKTVTPQMRASA
jgi:hypothetical protein